LWKNDCALARQRSPMPERTERRVPASLRPSQLKV
jgi:hypothetical protein